MFARLFTIALALVLTTSCQTRGVTEADIKEARECGPIAPNYKEQIVDTLKGGKLFFQDERLGPVSEPRDGLLTEGDTKLKGKIVHVDSVEPSGRHAMRYFFFACGNTVSLREYRSCYYPGNRSPRAVDCSKD